MCIGVFHFDDLQDRDAAVHDALTGMQNMTLHGLLGNAVQQPPRPRRREAAHQELGQPLIVQTNRVRIWSASDFDVLHRPTVVEDVVRSSSK